MDDEAVIGAGCCRDEMNDEREQNAIGHWGHAQTAATSIVVLRTASQRLRMCLSTANTAIAWINTLDSQS